MITRQRSSPVEDELQRIAVGAFACVPWASGSVPTTVVGADDSDDVTVIALDVQYSPVTCRRTQRCPPQISKYH